ncbi:MAG: alpha/beta hydrolase [Xanthomonadales bacterium]|nr:alpha/beta hydrolase [Xanthomonadales bacterium]
MLRLLPDALAASLAMRLAGIPRPPKTDPRDVELLSRGRPFEFGQASPKCGWEWGQGKLVVLVHGWSGRAAQLAPLACSIAKAGFRTLAFDATGHGESGGRHFGFDVLRADLVELLEHAAQPAHAILGHSAGGLAAMSGSAMGQVRADRYICIAAPLYPYPPIDTLRKVLHLTEGPLDLCRERFASQFSVADDQLRQGWSYSGDPDRRTLLVYDQQDGRVAHTDADRIQQLRRAEIIKTDGFGHNGLLRSEQLMEKVVRFLSEPDQSVHPTHQELVR